MICNLQNTVLYYIQAKLQNENPVYIAENIKFLFMKTQEFHSRQEKDSILMYSAGKEYINAADWRDD